MKAASPLTPYGYRPDASMVSIEKVAMNISGFETMQGGIGGMVKGGSMAAIAIAIGGTIFPPAGALVILAPVVGALLGGLVGATNAAANQREEFLFKMEQRFQDLAEQVKPLVMNHLDNLGSAYEQKIGEFFRNAVEQHWKRIEEQSEQALQAAGRSREENRSTSRQNMNPTDQDLPIRSEKAESTDGMPADGMSAWQRYRYNRWLWRGRPNTTAQCLSPFTPMNFP